MRRAARIVAWTMAFLIAAGIGAVIASRTDPFPPGVEDPGARPLPTATASTPTPTASPSELAQVWRGSLTAVGRHLLHVGGICHATFRGSIRLAVLPGGQITGVSDLARVGAGEAGDQVCDFPVAQVQTDRARLDVSGRSSASGALRVAFSTSSVDPVDSQDLGGVLPLTPPGGVVELAPDATTAATAVTWRRSDGNEGTFVRRVALRLRCVAGC